jgi:hypothetical protein
MAIFLMALKYAEQESTAPGLEWIWAVPYSCSAE